MRMPAAKRRPEPRDIAAEIIRRGAGSYVVRLSDPPTVHERLQLMAARLERRKVAIMPHKCETIEAWMARYGGPNN